MFVFGNAKLSPFHALSNVCFMYCETCIENFSMEESIFREYPNSDWSFDYDCNSGLYDSNQSTIELMNQLLDQSSNDSSPALLGGSFALTPNSLDSSDLGLFSNWDSLKDSFAQQISPSNYLLESECSSQAQSPEYCSQILNQDPLLSETSPYFGFTQLGQHGHNHQNQQQQQQHQNLHSSQHHSQNTQLSQHSNNQTSQHNA